MKGRSYAAPDVSVLQAEELAGVVADRQAVRVIDKRRRLDQVADFIGVPGKRVEVFAERDVVRMLHVGFSFAFEAATIAALRERLDRGKPGFSPTGRSPAARARRNVRNRRFTLWRKNAL